MHTVFRQSLKSLFCQRYGCSPSEYDSRAFRKCLYFHAKLVAPVIRRLNPEFFAPDLKFIRDLGESIGRREATAEALNYQDMNKARPGFWRTGCKIRVSGRKATSLAHSLFENARRSDPKTTDLRSARVVADAQSSVSRD